MLPTLYTWMRLHNCKCVDRLRYARQKAQATAVSLHRSLGSLHPKPPIQYKRIMLCQRQCTTPSGVGTRWRKNTHYKSELNITEWSASLPGNFTPTVSALRTYWYSWVGPQVGLNVMAKTKLADNFLAPAGSRTPCRPNSSLVTWLIEPVKDCAKTTVHIKENTAVTWLLASLTRTWCARTHVSLSQTWRYIPIPALS